MWERAEPGGIKIKITYKQPSDLSHIIKRFELYQMTFKCLSNWKNTKI